MENCKGRQKGKRGEMKTLIDEKTEYQQYFIARLTDAGYRERIAKDKYDKRYAMDTEELLAFLCNTQPEEMTTLEKIQTINRAGLRSVVKAACWMYLKMA